MGISEQFVLETSDIVMSTIHDASVTGNSLGILSTGEAKVSVTQPLPSGTASIGNVQINGLSSFQTSQYTIGTLAVQVTSTPLALRKSVSLKAVISTTTDVIYIGNSSAVAASGGYPLYNGDSVSFDLNTSSSIYAIGTSSGQTLCALEIGGS